MFWGEHTEITLHLVHPLPERSSKKHDLKVSVKNISHDVCLIRAQVFSQGFYGSVLCKSRSLTFYIPHALSSHSSTGTDNTGQIS